MLIISRPLGSELAGPSVIGSGGEDFIPSRRLRKDMDEAILYLLAWRMQSAATLPTPMFDGIADSWEDLALSGDDTRSGVEGVIDACEG